MGELTSIHLNPKASLLGAYSLIIVRPLRQCKMLSELKTRHTPISCIHNWRGTEMENCPTMRTVIQKTRKKTKANPNPTNRPVYSNHKCNRFYFFYPFFDE